MTSWDHEYDLLVMGSGGGGMTAALVAKLEGLDSIVFEKTEVYGGSTALSGGGVWIPNSHLMAAAGIPDSEIDAINYMKHTVGDRTPSANQEAYVKNSKEMLKYLEKNSHVKLTIMEGYPDYYPETIGGKESGRSLAPVMFEGRKLGKIFKNLKRHQYINELAFTAEEYKSMAMYKTDPSNLLTALKVLSRNIINNVYRLNQVSFGRSLIAMLRLSLDENNVPLWLNTAVKELIVEDGRVAGVRIEKDGKSMHVRGKKGVVLAAGGFPLNKEMREKYFRSPVSTEWSSANPANIGEAISMGMDLGADVDLMDDAWWGPTTTIFGDSPLFLVVERSYPGAIMVNSAGKRFVNESAPYTDVVHAMYDKGEDGEQSIPAYYVMDQLHRSTYVYGALMPGMTPKKHLKNDDILKADTLEELALQMKADPGELVETVKRFNEFSRTGKDLDFQRGNSVYDRFYSDPNVGPNPCLAPLDKPPFYASKLYPGDIGTKGGLKTNEKAQVIKKDGDIIDGLYAVGNTSASVMGNSYPGAGSTIGPGLTFGFIAARHAANK